MLLKSIAYKNGEALLVKYFRLLRNLSQDELAEACNWKSKTFVSDIENGKNISRDTRLLLATALQVEPWEFCKFDDLDKLRDTVEKMDAAFKKKRAEAKRQRRKKKVFRKRKVG